MGRLILKYRHKVCNGDCLQVLKTLPDNSVDSLVTDPPYGLSQDPDIGEVMGHWNAGTKYEHSSDGFMGKSWDSFVPGPEYWRECLRVMKPGAHGMVFAGTRTQDLMSIALRFAGFEIRDTLMWIHGQGFPKSHSIEKGIDKLNGDERPIIGKQTVENMKGNKYNSPGNEQIEINITSAASAASAAWTGWGSALKPAYEPIIMVRKPIEKGLSIAENCLKWGCGGLNIDKSRIALDAGADLTAVQRQHSDNQTTKFGGAKPGDEIQMYKANGRFPSNLLLSHQSNEIYKLKHDISPQLKVVIEEYFDREEILHAPQRERTIEVLAQDIPREWISCFEYSRWSGCVEVGVKKVKAISGTNTGSLGKNGIYSHAEGLDKSRIGMGDPDGTETVAAWECVEGCAVRMLDDQSGNLKSGARNISQKSGFQSEYVGGKSDSFSNACESSSGGASRFFKCFGPTRFLYQSKPSKREKNAGLGNEVKEKQGTRPNSQDDSGKFPDHDHRESGGNNHPTVKSCRLMKYLSTMITPDGGTILDPFGGSGTTLVAASMSGFSTILIEQSCEYMDIIIARAEHALAKSAVLSRLEKPL
jgi:DNA modification methylase